MIVVHELNRTLAVWRPQTAADGSGGQTVEKTEVGQVRAMVAQPSAAERIAAAQAGAAHTHPVYLLPTADVRRGDELRGDGQVLRVKATYRPSTPTYLRADCELIESEPENAES